MKKASTQLKDIEQRIRASNTYHQWVAHNLTSQCISCNATQNLQVHHLISLYHIILGLWQFYGDEDDVVAHAIAMHIDDKCENVTLCKTCHDKIHPGRSLTFNKSVRVEEWTVMPRRLPGAFLNNSKVAGQVGLSLVGAQLLAGIGWLIINGHMDSSMLAFKRSTMAKILDKKTGSSFNKALERNLKSLQTLDVILAWNIAGPDVEIHITPEYLQKLKTSPWFMSMKDVRTNKMPVFALRWFLNLQSGKYTYKIGTEKLVGHLGLKTKTTSFVERCVKKAVDDIPWLSVNFDGRIFSFRIRQRGSTPIWTLRTQVADAIEYGT